MVQSINMTQTTDEQVVWKTHPEYPWVEVSNLGRIKTVDHYVTCKNGSKKLVKGHILKQYFAEKGYMYVALNVNGKQVNLLVHRAVAISFLPNPDNLPEVNHKDNNRTNNRLDNLEWCTRRYNEDYKKNFGTTSAEVLGHPVFAVNLNTSRILYF